MYYTFPRGKLRHKNFNLSVSKAYRYMTIKLYTVSQFKMVIFNLIYSP